MNGHLHHGVVVWGGQLDVNLGDGVWAGQLSLGCGGQWTVTASVWNRDWDMLGSVVNVGL